MRVLTRADILEFLKQQDPNFYVEDNVIHASKVFVVNTVIQWCYKKLNLKQIKTEEMEFYLQAITAFLNDKINIYWDKDGNLVIS
jgi:hypothetical protein